MAYKYLNKIKKFDNNELIEFLSKNDYEEFRDVLKKTGIDGDSFLALSEFEVNRWKIYGINTRKLWLCLTKLKTDTESFFNDCPIKNKNDTNINRRNSFTKPSNDIRQKLEIVIKNQPSHLHPVRNKPPPLPIKNTNMTIRANEPEFPSTDYMAMEKSLEVVDGSTYYDEHGYLIPSRQQQSNDVGENDYEPPPSSKKVSTFKPAAKPQLTTERKPFVLPRESVDALGYIQGAALPRKAVKSENDDNEEYESPPATPPTPLIPEIYEPPPRLNVKDIKSIPIVISRTPSPGLSSNENKFLQNVETKNKKSPVYENMPKWVQAEGGLNSLSRRLLGLFKTSNKNKENTQVNQLKTTEFDKLKVRSLPPLPSDDEDDKKENSETKNSYNGLPSSSRGGLNEAGKLSNDSATQRGIVQVTSRPLPLPPSDNAENKKKLDPKSMKSRPLPSLPSEQIDFDQIVAICHKVSNEPIYENVPSMFKINKLPEPKPTLVPKLPVEEIGSIYSNDPEQDVESNQVVETEVVYSNSPEVEEPPSQARNYEHYKPSKLNLANFKLPIPPQNFPPSQLEAENFLNEDELEEYDNCIFNLNNEPFYRNTDRKGARLLLMNLEDGAFLFRPSKRFFLTLSVKYESKCFNLGIEKTQNNKIRINSEGSNMSPEFPTIADFITYFSREVLTFQNNNDIIEIHLKKALPSDRF